MFEKYTRLISFCSVRQAMAAEEVMNRFEIPAVLVPTPRQIHLSCGQCILFMAEAQDKVLTLLKEKNITWTKFFKRDPISKTYELCATNEEGLIEWEV